MQTENLKLTGMTREEVVAEVAAMGPAEKAHVSADWLAMLHNSASIDPWIHGFRMQHRATGAVVGRCGFKGPPTTDGVVEVAYGVDEEHQGKGYATEAAEALVRFAFNNEAVRTVLAHTLPEVNASTRVLTKCGFRRVGDVIDPDDGLVWRWEKQREK
jgi:RimJ/RimL family protein N-acetyltransferase